MSARETPNRTNTTTTGGTGDAHSDRCLIADHRYHWSTSAVAVVAALVSALTTIYMTYRCKHVIRVKGLLDGTGQCPLPLLSASLCFIALLQWPVYSEEINLSSDNESVMTDAMRPKITTDRHLILGQQRQRTLNAIDFRIYYIVLCFQSFSPLFIVNAVVKAFEVRKCSVYSDSRNRCPHRCHRSPSLTTSRVLISNITRNIYLRLYQRILLEIHQNLFAQTSLNI